MLEKAASLAALLFSMSLKPGVPNPRAIAHYRAAACLKPGRTSAGQVHAREAPLAQAEGAHVRSSIRADGAPWVSTLHSR